MKREQQFLGTDQLQNLPRQAHAATNAVARRYCRCGSALSTAAPNSVDRALHHGLRLTLFASVHESAVNVRLAQAANLGESINPNRSGAQVTRYLDQAWAEGLMQSSQNEFFKVRIAGVICLIEGMLMTFKARQLPDSDTRLKTELLAAAMTTAAAGFELGASYVDLVVSRYGARSVTGGGAAVVLGRLKLWGATLAGTAGSVWAWWDFADAREWSAQSSAASVQPARIRAQGLAYAYRTRAVATIALSTAEVGAALAAARPLFNYLARSSSSRLLSILGRIMLTGTGWLLAPGLGALLSRIIVVAFLITLISTVIVIIFDDDSFEKWCRRSSFRINKGTKPYEPSDELPELYSALSEVI